MVKALFKKKLIEGPLDGCRLFPFSDHTRTGSNLGQTFLPKTPSLISPASLPTCLKACTIFCVANFF